MKHWLVLGLLIFASAFSQSETIVTFDNEGQQVVGTLTVPDGSNYPLVLLFHGFTGTRDELPIVDDSETMFGRTARLLAEAGYASLRIDFRGSGESEGAWADTTFSGQISDALAALDYVTALPDVNGERLGIIGLSQGGLVASSIADDPRIASVVLWSPVANPPATYADIIGADVIQTALQTEDATTFALPWGGETTLGRAFFDDIYAIDPIAEITAYAGPLLVVVGALDDLVFPQPYFGQIYVDYHQGENRLVVFEEGNHIFNILATGTDMLDDAIAESIAWFDETL